MNTKAHIFAGLLKTLCGLYRQPCIYHHCYDEDEWWRADCVSCLRSLRRGVDERILEVRRKDRAERE